ncbi:MAG: rcc01693 family protein [Pseudomonadota bacterium]
MDWPALMRAGLQDLKLTPDVFWRLTPAELLLMLGDDAGAAPMGRDRLDALSRMFPDEIQKEGGDDRPG